MGIHLKMITPSVHFVVGITSHTKYNFFVGAMKIEVFTITIHEQLNMSILSSCAPWLLGGLGDRSGILWLLLVYVSGYRRVCHCRCTAHQVKLDTSLLLLL